jgi:hypothetical protein
MARRKFRVLEVRDNFVIVTDESVWQDRLTTFRCSRFEIEGAKVNDTITADTTLDSTLLENGFLETGSNAIYLRPVEFAPEAKNVFDPNDTGDAVQCRPDGSPFSAGDVDRMLREQDKKIASLVARLTTLECFSKTHCGHCQAILSAKGAFNK